MIHENEIIMLLLGLGVLIFILGNHVQLKRFPASKILMAGFYMLLGGWLLTVLEGFFWEGLLNYLEHMCYAGSSLLIAMWCWKIFKSKKEAK